MSESSPSENRAWLRALRPVLLFIGVPFVIYVILFGNPWRVEGDNSSGAARTKTAIAQTADALLGPFPTATVPTRTPSQVPSMTSTLPTATPTASRTATPTVTLFLSATPRVRESDPDPTDVGTATGRPPSTNTPIRPTSTAIRTTDTPPRPTDTSIPPATETEPPAPTATDIPILTAIPTLIETLLP